MVEYVEIEFGYVPTSNTEPDKTTLISKLGFVASEFINRLSKL